MSAKRILVNDGIHPEGRKALEAAGHIVVTEKVEQDHLPAELPNFDAIVVRSATKIRQDLIDQCPNLKLIARGGVGLDNIDVEYAEEKGIAVYNTPAASSHSVAELVFAHALNIARFLHQSNREMPVEGNNNFKGLKKAYSAGIELCGKTIGIVGFGRIGQEVARIALGMGMRVLAVDPMIDKAQITIETPGTTQILEVDIETRDLESVLPEVDILTLHVPSQKTALITSRELARMKQGVIVINASRGGIIDENDLIAALDSGHVAGAGLDVFVGEPEPSQRILQHPKISLSPHIGASTDRAQANIGLELAEKIINHFNGATR
ncbi:MAG: D-2-hydroxyacid dehydrogenase [Saprospiraceae bacterium]|nr:D-2-hydroxyacid dehydrogenase [Saprospiraceae bacterium]